METQASMLPLVAVCIPVVTAVLIGFARRVPGLRDAILVVGAVTTFACVAALVPDVLAGRVPTTELGELLPGVPAALRADPMGMVFAVLAASLWVLAGFYALGYMRGEGGKNHTRFYGFYALCLSTAFGVAFAADLFTFFVFYELLTVATYPLVTHKGDAKAVAAGRKYVGILLTGGALVLFGMLLVYQATGTLTFAAGGLVGDALGPTLTVVAFLLFAVGFGTKAGIMPLHAWLPAAMVAPTPVSALLHAVAVVKAGVFAFGRLIGFVFGPDVLADVGVQGVLSFAAGLTVVVASVVALRQDHLKRRLAFSTIAHLALIVLGFSLLSPEAYEGSLLHIVNHGVLKITLFFCAGAIHIAAHKDHVSELDGIGRRMPFTMTAFAVAAYGLAALPPMGGFVSKWYLTLGAVESDQLVYAGIVVFSGVFTAGYLFPVVYRAFFKPLPAPHTDPGHAHGHGHAPHGSTSAASGGDGLDAEVAASPPAPSPGGSTAVALAPPATDHGTAHDQPHGEASPLMVVPLCVTASFGLVLGLTDPGGVYDLARAAASAVFGGTP